MSAEKKIKLQANNLLHHNWTSTLGAFFIGMLGASIAIFILSGFACFINWSITELAQNIQFLSPLEEWAGLFADLFLVLSFVIVFLLMLPLFLGIYRYYYLFAKEENPQLHQVFYYCGKRYFRGLGITLDLLARCFWRTLLPLSPGIISLLILVGVTADDNTLAFYHHLWYLLSYILILVGIVIALKFSAKYFLVPFVFFDNEDMTIRDIRKVAIETVSPMKKNVSKLISSFTFWIFLCLLIFPIIYIIPYISICFSISAKWILALKNDSEEE